MFLNDKAQSYMIISLHGTWYRHYELPPATFDGLMAAPSMGQFPPQALVPASTPLLEGMVAE